MRGACAGARSLAAAVSAAPRASHERASASATSARISFVSQGGPASLPPPPVRLLLTNGSAGGRPPSGRLTPAATPNGGRARGSSPGGALANGGVALRADGEPIDRLLSLGVQYRGFWWTIEELSILVDAESPSELSEYAAKPDKWWRARGFSRATYVDLGRRSQFTPGRDHVNHVNRWGTIDC